MEMLASTTGRWTVSARPTGETLVVRCEDSEVLVVTFGGDAPDAAAEQQRLRELVRAARAAAESEPVPAPIPRMVHHILARLMQLEGASKARRAGVVLFDDGQQLAAGIVGEIDTQVKLDDRPAQLPWVRLRDRAGHQGRAFLFPVGRRAQLIASWSSGRGDHERSAMLEARCAVSLDERETVTMPEAHDRSAPPVAPAAVAPHAPSGGAATPKFFQWLDQMAQRDRIPTAADAARSTPSSSEDSTAAMASDAPSAEPAPRTPQVHANATSLPERIPPTPEPPELTRLALAPMIEIEQPDDSRAPADEPIIIERAVEPAPALLRPEPIHDERSFEETRVDAAGRARAVAPSIDPEPAPQPPVAAPRPQIVPAASPATPPKPRLAAPKPLRLVPPSPPDWTRRRGASAWRWAWIWGLVALVVAAGVWLVSGPLKSSRPHFALPSFGPRFTVAVTSQPPGASIAIDGKDLGKITPATLELAAGEHEMKLTLEGKGSAVYKVSGGRDEHTSVEALMYGGVKITAADPNVPVAITLDGLDRGYAPLSVQDLLPGPHEIRFRAPGMDPWSDTFELEVGELHEVVARPFSVPQTGMIEVRATHVGVDGVEPLRGATIFVDGQPRGVTPQTVELPHGPHSIRVVYRDEAVPVQVIDLPGGNHRIAEFTFGTDFEPPGFVQLTPPGAIGRDQPTVISAAITGLEESELREMWLHARAPDGSWRRYEMTLLRASGGVVGVVVYPVTMVGDDGSATYYVSALTQEGEEYFTEMRGARGRAGRGTGTKRAAAAPSPEETTPSTP